ncbi:MAG: hypothetical protein ACM3ZC_12515 [Bacteroidota bacterium]
MAEDKPREIELYTCNKYPLQKEGDEVILCNAPSYCDAETKLRRRCAKVKIVPAGGH